MSIILTPAAARRIQSQISARGRGIGLKLGVKKSGCSGYAYVLAYADQVGNEDVVFESAGAKVLVGRSDLPLLNGLTIDFRKDGLNEVFSFNNPNVTSQCGCGESFAV